MRMQSPERAIAAGESAAQSARSGAGASELCRVPPAPRGGASGPTLYRPATKRATTALVMTPWVTLVHASAARTTAG